MIEILNDSIKDWTLSIQNVEERVLRLGQARGLEVAGTARGGIAVVAAFRAATRAARGGAAVLVVQLEVR